MKFFNARSILRGMEPLAELPSDRTLLSTTVSMAWPSILESFLIALVGMMDTVMVGTLGAYAIAAVGLTTQPKFIGLAIFLSLNVAVSAIVARRFGESDRESANKVLVQALLITGGLTVVVSIIAVTFANQILAFTGSAPDTHADAVAYFRIIMGGLAFNTISMVINAAQRGVGNTKIAMRTNVVSNLINICFNYLLIGGNFGFPRLGVRGAAIATVIGAMVACGMSIRSISYSSQFLHFENLLRARFDRVTLKAIANIGSSTLAEQVFMRIGFLLYAMIVARLGTVAFAAHQIGMNVITISFSFGDGLSAAAIALVGQSLGANRVDLAKIYGGVCQRFAVLFSIGLSIIYLTCGKLLFMMFSRDPQILSYGEVIMAFMTIIVFLQISQVVYSSCLRAAGDTLYTAFVSLVSVAFVRPFCGWLFCFPLGLGLAGAWLGLTVDQICRFLFTWLRFRSGRWTRFKI